MPEVATLICDEPRCRQRGIRYWYYTAVGRQREVILCPDHNVFTREINNWSRPARNAAPKTRRRPTVTSERLDAMFVDDTVDQP